MAYGRPGRELDASGGKPHEELGEPRALDPQRRDPADRPERQTVSRGTSTGVYGTTALAGDATAWTQEGGDTVGNTVVWLVRARTSDNLVAVGTHGRGMFVRQTCGDAQTTLQDAVDEAPGGVGAAVSNLRCRAGLG